MQPSKQEGPDVGEAYKKREWMKKKKQDYMQKVKLGQWQSLSFKLPKGTQKTEQQRQSLDL